jgi:hypothetical protein
VLTRWCILAQFAMNKRFRVGWGLFLIAATPRLLGAFFLPNTFGDAYVYIRDIGNLSTKIKSGTFVLTDLYGFWLPLYQLVSAVINAFVGNGFYTGKVVAALFGAGVCLLVYAITLQLVEHKIAAFLSFLLIALSPLHILTSTSALTDVPHAFFVLSALYFVLKRRWLAAGIFAALAGLTRVESWMLIALIPTLQFWEERKVSAVSLLIMLLPPLFWFWVSWQAAGDWLATFKVRHQYLNWLLTQNPALQHFTFAGVIKDTTMFLSGVDVAVLSAAFTAGWLVLRWTGKHRDDAARKDLESIMPPLIFFFPFFALLTIAYLTHQQPIIFPRYGLILFSLGLPILAWTYFALARRHPHWSRRILVGIALLCALNFCAQFAGAGGELNRYAAQRRVADYLRSHYDVNSRTSILCDEGTVRVLTGIPDNHFVNSVDTTHDAATLRKFVEDSRIKYFIVPSTDESWFEHLALHAADTEKPIAFRLVFSSHSKFLKTDIRVYERKPSAFD